MENNQGWKFEVGDLIEGKLGSRARVIARITDDLYSFYKLFWTERSSGAGNAQNNGFVLYDKTAIETFFEKLERGNKSRA
jgi:hypothetical protein